MKLFLSSNGLSNKSLDRAFLDLICKKPSETNLVFIPTASNIINDDKQWLIDDLKNISKHNFKKFDIVDISSLNRDEIMQRFDEADVLFFSGGNPFYLMYWFRKIGLEERFEELLADKVYAGISAGSMVAGLRMPLKYKEESQKYVDKKKKDLALGFVDYNILPHFNSKYFPEYTRGSLDKSTKEYKETFYALDDDSAIVINGNSMNVVSEGEWDKFN